MLQTNIHPDGHIYLHGIAGNSANLQTHTLFNRIEVRNAGADTLRIGKIRLMRAPDLPATGGAGLLIFGLDTEDGHDVLRPGNTLLVYLAFASTIPAGYVGVLDVPVLDGHTGVHAHVFISRTSSGFFQRRMAGLRSGVYPVFVYEGLRIALEAGGSSGTLKPVNSKSGEGLRLRLSALGIPKGNWALPPPKDPKYSVFQSTNPLLFAIEDLVSAVTAMANGAMLPMLKPQDGLKMQAAQFADGELEQKLKTTWPKQGGDGFGALAPEMLDGELDVKPAVIHVTWPQQGSNGFAAAAPEILDGELVVKIYSTISMDEETPLFTYPPEIIGGELETL